MFYRVKRVLPQSNLKLLVQFVCGETKEYDVSPLLEKWPIFQALKTTPGLFEFVQVDAGGYGIYWNDDIDLSCDELWYNGNLIESDKN